MCTEQGPKYRALVKRLSPCSRLHNSIRGQHLRELAMAAVSGTFPPGLSNPCPAAAPSPVAAPAPAVSPIPPECWWVCPLFNCVFFWLILALATFYIINLSYFYLRSINRTVCTGRNGPNTAASFNIMRSFKSPFPLDLTNSDVYGTDGEAVGENHNNNNFRNNVPRFLTPPEGQGGDNISFSWDANNGDANNNFSGALKERTEELKSNRKAI